MKIKIKKLHKDAVIPKYAHPGDVGLDLYSMEDYDLKPGERKLFFIGIAMEFPVGYAAIIKDKSGISTQGGLHTLGGVFDAGYRGEYNVCLINLSKKTYSILKGHKIAQLVVFPVAIAQIKEVNKLSESSRGEGKFGSTGR